MKKIRTIALFIALVLLMTGCAEASLTADNTVLISLASDSVTITEEGTYIIQGTLEDGSIIIDAGDEDKIQLIRGYIR